ncbi:MAG: hypothetical protein HN348_12245 [Proteobacteria bacterium]|nr:hypothetical protein [Pseudomonadota bacterium]
MFRFIAAVLLMLGLVFSDSAMAAQKPQIITVAVTDAANQPIPSAWVRLPETEGRRNVDPETGVWEASMLYTYDGRPLIFTKGMKLVLSISAPGFLTRKVFYEVRSRGNDLVIPLEAMPEQQLVEEEEDELLIDWFNGAKTRSE